MSTLLRVYGGEERMSRFLEIYRLSKIFVTCFLHFMEKNDGTKYLIKQIFKKFSSLVKKEIVG